MKTDQKTADHMARVAALIVEQIEQGAGAWQMPWHNLPSGHLAPTNPTTGNTYTGGNAVALWLIGQSIGAPNYWATYKQWKAFGAQVNRGEEAAARCLRPLEAFIEDKETGEKRKRVVGFSSFAVFHAGQVTGWEAPGLPEVPAVPVDAAESIEAAYRWVRRVGATLRLVAKPEAYYRPAIDDVTLPTVELWRSPEDAWSTAAHELCHWTGHESRLRRDLTTIKRFGDDAYAVEELTAELGAAMTLAAIGRHAEPRPDHAQYLAGWLRVLKADPAHLFTIAAKAQAAASYLAKQTDTIGLAA